LPKGKQAKALIDLMEASKKVLSKHDVNKVRIDLDENPKRFLMKGEED